MQEVGLQAASRDGLLKDHSISSSTSCDAKGPAATSTLQLSLTCTNGKGVRVPVVITSPSARRGAQG